MIYLSTFLIVGRVPHDRHFGGVDHHGNCHRRIRSNVPEPLSGSQVK